MLKITRDQRRQRGERKRLIAKRFLPNTTTMTIKGPFGGNEGKLPGLAHRCASESGEPGLYKQVSESPKRREPLVRGRGNWSPLPAARGARRSIGVVMQV